MITKREFALLACFGSPDDLVFWSFRYFLGRRSIQTCCFAENLAKAWQHLSPDTAYMIRRELDEAFRVDDRMRADATYSRLYSPLGADCDREAWELVRGAYGVVEKEGGEG